jgi:hypothetical protein
VRRSRVPKVLDTVFAFYSPFVYLETLAICFAPLTRGVKAVGLLLILYLQAPVLWRLLTALYGPVPQVSRFGKKAEEGSLWFAGNRLQELYESFEGLERFLKTIPGLYSAWLRLWGARIGKKVNWTPGCKVVDRPFVRIGDRSLIGNLAYLAAHAIKKKDGRYVLFVKEVTIGSDVVISYASTIAPGAVIRDRAFIESGAVVYPNREIPEGGQCERFAELLDRRFDFLRTKP